MKSAPLSERLDDDSTLRMELSILLAFQSQPVKPIKKNKRLKGRLTPSAATPRDDDEPHPVDTSGLSQDTL